MKRHGNRFLVLGIPALGLLLATAPQASAWQAGGEGQMPGEPGAGAERPGMAPKVMLGELTTVTAKVDEVDKQNRMLRLRDQAGNEHSIRVPEEMRAFDQIKRGDRITVRYYESLAASLQPAGNRPTGFSQRTVMGPHGMMGQVTAVSRITAVDTEKDKLTIQGPAGRKHTIKVSDPALQQRLSQLKPGENVQVTYTEALAASLTRAPAQ